MLTEHADVFQVLGKFPGPPVRLHPKEGYKAASRGIHKVPVHMEKGFAGEVVNIVNQGIIRWIRDDDHSKLVNSYVLVNKRAQDGTAENMVSAEKI